MERVSASVHAQNGFCFSAWACSIRDTVPTSDVRALCKAIHAGQYVFQALTSVGSIVGLVLGDCVGILVGRRVGAAEMVGANVGAELGFCMIIARI